MQGLVEDIEVESLLGHVIGPTRRRVPLAAALGRRCGMKTSVESEGKTEKTKEKTEEGPTSGSSRHGQVAGFRFAKVFGFIDRLSLFAPLVRAA